MQIPGHRRDYATETADNIILITKSTVSGCRLRTYSRCICCCDRKHSPRTFLSLSTIAQPVSSQLVSMPNTLLYRDIPRTRCGGGTTAYRLANGSELEHGRRILITKYEYQIKKTDRMVAVHAFLGHF